MLNSSWHGLMLQDHLANILPQTNLPVMIIAGTSYCHNSLTTLCMLSSPVDSELRISNSKRKNSDANQENANKIIP